MSKYIFQNHKRNLGSKYAFKMSDKRLKTIKVMAKTKISIK